MWNSPAARSDANFRPTSQGLGQWGGSAVKPMLATDWDESKVSFPVVGEPKVDGVRGLNMHGGLTGRSLKLFKNRFTTSFYSQEFFKGFDGELAAAEETHPDLCRLTTSALGTITGEPFTLWWLFDYLNPLWSEDPGYWQRYQELKKAVAGLQIREEYQPWAGRLRVIPAKLINNIEDLNAFDEENLAAGFEGTIIRDPYGKYKHGRSTVREGGLLRIKQFIESEAIVEAIVEGRSNQNEAQVNELGLQFRSSHQENMVSNGLVGSLTCRALATVKDRNTVVIEKDQIITVSPGNMPHDLRKYYFENQHELLGKTIKFKFFPKGIKDKPRFPTFVTIRQAEDM